MPKFSWKERKKAKEEEEKRLRKEAEEKAERERKEAEEKAKREAAIGNLIGEFI